MDFVLSMKYAVNPSTVNGRRTGDPPNEVRNRSSTVGAAPPGGYAPMSSIARNTRSGEMR